MINQSNALQHLYNLAEYTIDVSSARDYVNVLLAEITLLESIVEDAIKLPQDEEPLSYTEYKKDSHA